MKSRHIAPLISAALKDTPVVYLRGPRQSGKTTLVREGGFAGSGGKYLSFDKAAIQSAARADPDAFLRGLPRRIVLDEVQRVPELILEIKHQVDENRQPGRFLLTGSANILTLPKISESLAGRMEVLTLWPFSQGEIEGRTEKFIDACFAKSFRHEAGADSSWSALTRRIVAGGYPEALGRTDPMRREAWFESYLTTILERDVRDISRIQNLGEIGKLLRMVATRTAGLVNLADLSRTAHIAQTTLQRHWALLETIFLLGTLPAWNANLGKRLVKSPKAFLHDTGLLCYLLGIDEQRLEEGDLMAGEILETFVAGELRRQISWSRVRPRLFHFRTHGGREVDFIMEDRRGRVVGIEVKKTASPKKEDFKGLEFLSQLLGKRFLRGLLLHCGDDHLPFGPKLHAVPLASLWS
jgi:predicted AAA+ superfamily ATPase